MSAPKKPINIPTIEGTVPLPLENPEVVAPKGVAPQEGRFGGKYRGEEGGFKISPEPESVAPKVVKPSVKKRSETKPGLVIKEELTEPQLTEANLNQLKTIKPEINPPPSNSKEDAILKARKNALDLREAANEDYLDITTKKEEQNEPPYSDPEIDVTKDKEPVIESSTPNPAPIITGGAQQSVDPLTSFLLNMMFVLLFYFVATKIFTFYGIGTEIYGLYFTFYLFLYLSTMILPTEYKKIK